MYIQKVSDEKSLASLLAQKCDLADAEEEIIELEGKVEDLEGKVEGLEGKIEKMEDTHQSEDQRMTERENMPLNDYYYEMETKRMQVDEYYKMELQRYDSLGY